MRHHHRLAVVALVAASIPGLSACNPLHRQGASRSNAPPVVIFRNQAMAEAAVYAISRSGAESRIGTVQPGRTDTLTVDGAVTGASGAVTIVARLLAFSTVPSTGPLTLLPGDRIAVTLPPDARLLTVLPARR